MFSNQKTRCRRQFNRFKRWKQIKNRLAFFFDKFDISSNNSTTEIEQKLLGDVANVFANADSQCRTYEIENETAEFFLEIISPPVNLVIFGAGYDAISVAEFAKNFVCLWKPSRRFCHARKVSKGRQNFNFKTRRFARKIRRWRKFGSRYDDTQLRARPRNSQIFTVPTACLHRRTRSETANRKFVAGIADKSRNFQPNSNKQTLCSSWFGHRRGKSTNDCAFDNCRNSECFIKSWRRIFACPAKFYLRLEAETEQISD